MTVFLLCFFRAFSCSAAFLALLRFEFHGFRDKVKGLIPESVCVELLNKYQAERNEKAAQLKELEQQLDTTQAVQDDAQAWADLIRQYRTIDTLDRETLLRLINKIEVGEKKIVNGQKEQEIRIHYKFVGYIQ